MAQFDKASMMKGTALIAPAVVKVDTTSNGFDITDNVATSILIHAGAYVDTTFTFSLLESDDDVTYTTVAASDIIGSFPKVETTSATAQTGIVGYVGYKKYIKVKATKGGTASTGSLISAFAIGCPMKSCPAD